MSVSINTYCACGFVAFNIFKQVDENSAVLFGFFPLQTKVTLMLKKVGGPCARYVFLQNTSHCEPVGFIMIAHKKSTP